MFAKTSLKLWLAPVLFLAFVQCTIESNVSRELGARCEDRSECDYHCAGGQLFPDGMCTMGCKTDGDCPGNTRCVDAQGGICLYACGSSDDCNFLGDSWDCQIDSHYEDGLETQVCETKDL